MTRPSPRRSALAFGAAALVGLLAWCGGSPADHPSAVLDGVRSQQAEATPSAAAAAPSSSGNATCSPPPAATFPPLSAVPAADSLPAGSLEATIRNRGYLVVGVSGDTRLLSARDLLHGGVLEGFEIDLAKAIGRALFGADDAAHVRFRVVTAAQRFPQVNAGAEAGGVDMVVRVVSATCDRWAATDPAKGSLFSAAYLTSDQRLMVRTSVVPPGTTDAVAALRTYKQRTGDASPVRICAPRRTTVEAKVSGIAGVSVVPVAIHSDCLALWREGRVDAITGGEEVLAGFIAQDSPFGTLSPRAEIVGASIDRTPYVVAIARSHPEFVQYVNAVMASPAFRSAWAASYGRWLAPSLGPGTFPAPDYGRPLPA